MKVDKKQIAEIMREIEQSLATVMDPERAYWKLSPEERAQLPESLRIRFESLSG